MFFGSVMHTKRGLAVYKKCWKLFERHCQVLHKYCVCTVYTDIYIFLALWPLKPCCTIRHKHSSHESLMLILEIYILTQKHTFDQMLNIQRITLSQIILKIFTLWAK